MKLSNGSRAPLLEDGKMGLKLHVGNLILFKVKLKRSQMAP